VNDSNWPMGVFTPLALVIVGMVALISIVIWAGLTDPKSGGMRIEVYYCGNTPTASASPYTLDGQYCIRQVGTR